MPMNPRLLRPTQGGFVSPDADARAYLAAVRVADGANLEPAVAKAISDFVIGCKADGIWDAIKASCILCGAKTLSGALTPLKGTAPTNNGPFVSGDYDRKTGLVGNGSTKWLDSGRNNNTDPQDSKHIAVYRSVAATNDAGIIGSNNTTSGHSHIYTGFGQFIFRNNSSTAFSPVSLSNFPGAVFAATSRNASGTASRIVGSSQDSGLADSQTPANATIRVFETGGRTNARMSFYSIGEAIDLGLFRTLVDSLIAAIGAAI
jgi:hypothetical protein